MNIQEAREYIAENHPQTIHISGKTSTGKSTLANELRDSFGYGIIELDEIVMNEIVSRNKSSDQGLIFAEVYKNRNRLDWINQFISATKTKIDELHSAEVNSIIDGAIANHKTLNEILDGTDSIIIYLHPENLEVYIRNLTSRFLTATSENKAGLPLKFWDKIPSDSFKSFLRDKQLSLALKDAIEAYAKESQAESTKRLEIFKANFNNILVVNV
jgi:adenylate kinase family enzyme